MEATTCKKELLIEIPVDIVKREVDSVAGQFAKRARIPGFRPGHAPTALVRRHFQGDIRSEVAQTLIPRFFDTEVKKQNWEVVGNPQFDEVKFEDDQPLSCKATFEIFPDFELKNYKELEIEEEPAVVADADVEKSLDDLRETVATFEVVNDRPAQDDDFVTVSYRGQDVAAPESKAAEAKEVQIQLGGKHTVPAFTENLRGVKAGDVKEFQVTYGEDSAQQSMAGKTISYRVEILSIKKKVVPPADDELAKSVSEYATLEELKTRLRQDLEKNAQRQVEIDSRQKLADKLLALHEFPVPQELVESQMNRKIQHTFTQLYRQGFDPRQVQVDWKKMREDGRVEAERSVRAGLILGRIVEAEKIDLSEEELDDVIREIAQEERVAPAELKTRLTRDGKLDTLKSTRRNQKALDFIYRNAKITRKNV